MTAIDTNTDVLDALARGDSVHVIEAAKTAAYTLAEAVDAQAQQRSPEHVFEATSEQAEELLAVLFPMIEYGDERALEAIPRILLYVGGRTSAALQETGAHRVGGAVVLGRVVWAAVAYAIHCGRFDALAQAARATVRVPFSNGDIASLIALTALRYSDALGGNAGLSYENYHGWLEARQLIQERYLLFSSELDDVFSEADLLLAMLLAQHRGGWPDTPCDRLGPPHASGTRGLPTCSRPSVGLIGRVTSCLRVNRPGRSGQVHQTRSDVSLGRPTCVQRTSELNRPEHDVPRRELEVTS